MKILALDTTTRAGSAALVDDDRVVDERAGSPARTHAERLPGELLELLSAHGLTLRDIDLFAVASGPGSFTGLRIGIATVQGLAFTSGRRLVAVSALDALAHVGSIDAPAGTHIAAWIDARRRDVFAALYRVDAPPPFDLERLSPLDGPIVAEPAAILDRWRIRLAALPSAFIGDGATLFGEAITAAVPSARLLAAPPLAGAIGRLAIRHAQRGETLDPAGVQPLYVRRPDAEVARDRTARP